MPKRTILVVDDSETDRYFIAEMLRSASYNVVSVGSAEAALAQIRESRPDLVLMDIMMRGQDGWQTTRELKRGPETSTIPIIVCTSKTQPTDEAHSKAQGATDYISKPIQREELLAKIGAALG